MPRVPSIKRGLQGVDCRDFCLFEHRHAQSSLFGLLHLERTVGILEQVAYLGEYIRESTRDLGLRWDVAAVHEYLLAARMAVKIADQLQWTLGLERLDQLFSVEDCRMQGFVRSFPSAIQIHAQQTAAVVTVDHSVWVQHRNQFEDEVVAQKRCLWRWTSQELDHPFHYPGTHTLARVYPGAYHYGTLLFCLCELRWVRDRQQLTTIAAYRLAQHSSAKDGA